MISGEYFYINNHFPVLVTYESIQKRFQGMMKQDIETVSEEKAEIKKKQNKRLMKTYLQVFQIFKIRTK